MSRENCFLRTLSCECLLLRVSVSEGTALDRHPAGTLLPTAPKN